MYISDFSIQAGDRNIGTLYLPSEASTNLPVIIYCHGWKGGRQLWIPTEKLCEKAISNNIAFVTFDFFGCGETGGNYGDMTYKRWKNNLSDMISWVEKQSFANKEKIGCYGFSSGSTAALRLAAEDERIAFVVSVGTCVSAHIGMGSGGPAKILADDWGHLMSGGKVSLMDADLGFDFYIDTISQAPIHVMDKIKCPVFFLQGTADNIFRCADAKMGYDAMTRANLPAKHVEIPGGNHELENVYDECAPMIIDWLNNIGIIEK